MKTNWCVKLFELLLILFLDMWEFIMSLLRFVVMIKIFVCVKHKDIYA